MSQSQLKYSVTVLIILCCFIVVQSNDNRGKSSLTFVIDDTASMSDDIDQVIEASNKIFDTVTNSKKSPIDNFVLVTFNDPSKYFFLLFYVSFLFNYTKTGHSSFNNLF